MFCGCYSMFFVSSHFDEDYACKRSMCSFSKPYWLCRVILSDRISIRFPLCFFFYFHFHSIAKHNLMKFSISLQKKSFHSISLCDHFYDGNNIQFNEPIGHIPMNVSTSHSATLLMILFTSANYIQFSWLRHQPLDTLDDLNKKIRNF